MARSKQSIQEDARRREAWKKRRQRQSSPRFVVAKSDGYGDCMPTNCLDSESLGLPRLADRIFELIAPIISLDKTLMENAIRMGIAAWNIAVSPEDIREEMIRDLLVAMAGAELSTDEASSTLFLATLQGLVDRKTKMFPNDGRYIAWHKIGWSFRGCYLDVVASLSPHMVSKVS
jgi:hypothetical protein